MEWIKTSDRLPELYGGISKRVLLWNQKYEFAELGYLNEVKEGYVWMNEIGLSPLDHYPYWHPITPPEESESFDRTASHMAGEYVSYKEE